MVSLTKDESQALHNPRSILNDKQIAELCKGDKPLITPFHPGKIKKITVDGEDIKAISFGNSEFGYDITLGNEFKYPKPGVILDPKNNNEDDWYTVKTDKPFIMSGNSFCIASVAERFIMPLDLSAYGFDKSTYSRIGFGVAAFVFEPGWAGYPTIGIRNSSPNPIRVYPNEGFARVIFLRGQAPEAAYGDDGKYQNQEAGAAIAKV